jgi:hypothetical protein
VAWETTQKKINKIIDFSNQTQKKKKKKKSLQGHTIKQKKGHPRPRRRMLRLAPVERRLRHLALFLLSRRLHWLRMALGIPVFLYIKKDFFLHHLDLRKKNAR